ncbi:MAG TPA: GNAT family N-acetyltransferase [Acidimicrobiia bacterium]|nr:GNAT family N-acetyltransferase [Acidimicrobiia bacterium]
MTTLEYRTTTDGLTADQLDGGFFAGWLDPPSPETMLRILDASDHVVIAVRDDQVIGFVTAISDGVLSAFITLLEVLPEHHNKGIGHSLINQMMSQIGDIYMVDLVCDANLSRFYAELGFAPTAGMSRRDYAMQSGRPA